MYIYIMCTYLYIYIYICIYIYIYVYVSICSTCTHVYVVHRMTRDCIHMQSLRWFEEKENQLSIHIRICFIVFYYNPKLTYKWI